jgi:hypothetical protein
MASAEEDTLKDITNKRRQDRVTSAALPPRVLLGQRKRLAPDPSCLRPVDPIVPGIK